MMRRIELKTITLLILIPEKLLNQLFQDFSVQFEGISSHIRN